MDYLRYKRYRGINFDSNHYIAKSKMKIAYNNGINKQSEDNGRRKPPNIYFTCFERAV